MGDRVGQQLGTYHLLHLLSEDQETELYLAEHVEHKTRVAIKCAKYEGPKVNVEPSYVARMRTLVGLQHPHIARVVTSGAQEYSRAGMEMLLPFLVLAPPEDMLHQIRGTLRSLYPRSTRLSLTTLLHYVRQIAAALQFAHDHGKVFYELEPENMLVTADNTVLLADGVDFRGYFLESEPLIHAPPDHIAYMAPDLLQGEPRPASNQYALGAIVYEWLCGSPPFGSTPWPDPQNPVFWGPRQDEGWNIVMNILQGSPLPPHQLARDIPPAVEIVVLTALAKDPRHRFASVEAFAQALERASELPFSMIPSAPLHPPPFVSPFPAPPPAVVSLSSEATLCTYTGHTDAIRALVWSPNGKHLASAGADGTVQVWDTDEGTVIFTYRGHTGAVNAVAWSPDGMHIASAGEDGTLQVWQWQGEQQATVRFRYEDPLYAVAWSPDAQYIATAGDRGTVGVWTTTPSEGLPWGGSVLTYYGHAVVVSDGQFIHAGDGDKDMDTLIKEGRTCIPVPVYALAWSPDGRRIASGDNDHRVHVWDALTGEHVFVYRDHAQKVNAVAWSPNGGILASASDDHMVRTWVPVPDATIMPSFDHASPVHALSWSPDGKRIAAGDAGSAVHLWGFSRDSLSQPREWLYQGHLAPVRAVAWSPDGTCIASAGDDHTVQLWTESL